MLPIRAVLLAAVIGTLGLPAPSGAEGYPPQGFPPPGYNPYQQQQAFPNPYMQQQGYRPPVQFGIRCATQFGICVMGQPGQVGTMCSCATPTGFVPGQILP